MNPFALTPRGDTERRQFIFSAAIRFSSSRKSARNEREVFPLYYSCGNKVIFLVTFSGTPITSDAPSLSCKFSECARDVARKISSLIFLHRYNLRLQMFAFQHPSAPNICTHTHTHTPFSQKILNFSGFVFRCVLSI